MRFDEPIECRPPNPAPPPDGTNRVRTWRLIAVLVATVLMAWLGLAYGVLPEPELILSVESDSTEPALLYVDDGTGLREVPSLLNGYQARHSPARMHFPLEVERVQFLRWDPIPLAGAEPVQLTVHAIAIRVSPLTEPIPVPLRHLIPLRGVERERCADTGALHLTVPAHTHDPMMELRLPDTLGSDTTPARRAAAVQLFFIAGGALLSGLLLRRLMGPVRNPVPKTAS